VCVCVKARSLEIDLDQTILEVETSVAIVFHQGEKGMCIFCWNQSKPAIKNACMLKYSMHTLKIFNCKFTQVSR